MLYRSVISLAVESGEIGGIYGVLSIFKAILGSTVGRERSGVNLE